MDEDAIHPYFWDQEGNNISFGKLKELFENPLWGIIGKTLIDNYAISTVWLGICHRGIPFETIIFDLDSEIVGAYRHKSKEEAKQFHLYLTEKYLNKRTKNAADSMLPLWDALYEEGLERNNAENMQ